MRNINKVWLQIVDFVTSPESRVTGILFGLNSILFMNWTVRLPDIKHALAINDGQIGLALLATPIGAILFSPICNNLSRKYGVGKVSFWSMIAMCMATFLIGLSTTYPFFIISLGLLGMSSGSLDISMNGAVTAIEEKTGKVLMSRAHGFWSFGAMIGSLVASVFAGLQIDIVFHLLIIAVLCILIARFATYSILQPISFHSETKKKLTLPSTRLVLLIIVIFMMFLVEGGIAEWNALFYDEILNAPGYLWGVGFGGYAFFMAIARFSGDMVLERWSSRQIIITCSTMIIICLTIFSFATNVWIATAIMSVCGIFTAVMVPCVFREAGRDRKVSPEAGIAMASVFGYSGFLIGPPALGFIAHTYDLRTVFLVLALSTFIVLGIGLSLRHERTS
jgi:MFS family permease